MLRRLTSVIASLAMFTGASLVPAVTAPALGAAAAGPSSMVIAEFDSAGEWYVSSGAGTVSTVSAPRTSGTGALQVNYNLSSQSGFVVRRSGTPDALPGLPSYVSLDIDGDSSWTVVYYEVTDATGEVLRYWVGNVGFTGWQTMTLDIAHSAPVSGLDGDQDKVLDLPIVLSQVVLWRNPQQAKSVSTIYFDHLTYQYDPNGASAATQIFVPSTGGSSAVNVSLSDQASFNLTLTDELGHTRGMSGNGPSWSTKWGGTDAAGTVMVGSVQGRLSVTRDSATATYHYPFFAGLPARAPGSDPTMRGVHGFISQYGAQQRATAEHEARLMEAAYVGIDREEFEWKRVEPAQGRFDWDQFDQAVELDRAHGIEVLGKLVYGSPWDNTAPAGTPLDTAVMYPPHDVSHYADYARAVVHRYKDRVHYWEIWNEENNSGFWKPSPNAAAYTTLLKAAYAAIKAEDPTAIVILGGLSTGCDTSYLRAVRDNGGWSSFDALAIHTYVSADPAGSSMEIWLDECQNLVNSYGLKPIWVTEFGWSTYSGGSVTADEQKAYVARAYELGKQHGVAGMQVFEFANHGQDARSEIQNYGVINYDFTPKPAYSGLACELQALYAGTPPDCGFAPPPPPPPIDATNNTFTGVTPTRILDTRIALGLSGAFVSGTPRTFQVAGNLGESLGTVVPDNASAVVGNLTVTQATSLGYVYLGPNPTSSPTSSTINFPAKDNRANGVTVPLSKGTLSATFKGTSRTSVHLIFDVTGYYLPNDEGNFFVPVEPTRLLDSRYGNGVGSTFLNRVPQTFAVKGRTNDAGAVVVPADAVAVTGNLTITNQSTLGYAYIGPDSTGTPSSSTLNAPLGDNRANNVTVALDDKGALSAVWVGKDGSRADLIFDVTGYFTKSGGLRYTPVTPARVLDSRVGNGVAGVFANRVPRGFIIRGRGGIPAEAVALTGNLTVTGQTSLGYGFMAGGVSSEPTSSTLNFPVGDNRANGVTLRMSDSGGLEIVFVGRAGATTHFVLDVSGYFH